MNEITKGAADTAPLGLTDMARGSCGSGAARGSAVLPVRHASPPVGQPAFRSKPQEGGEETVGTSSKDASKAGKLLANPKTPANVKSVAASDLAQHKGKSKGK